MQVYSELVVAYFERLASDPVTALAEGRFFYDTALDVVRWYTGAAWKTAADLESAQTVTGQKTMTSPRIATAAEFRAAAESRYYNSGNTFYVGFKGPEALANKIWTLPLVDGSADQVLKTNGSAVLGWATALLNPMDAIGQVIYGGASGVATKLAAGSDGMYLRSGGAGAPTWSAVDLASSSVTGITPIANGGTGSSTFISQGSFTVVYSGPFTSSGSLTCYYSIIGKVVTLYFPAFATQSASAATAITVTPTSFPAGAYPAAVQDILLVPVRNNGADKATPGVLRMPTSGNFSIFPDYATGTFTNASTCGIQSNFSVSYRIAS